MLMLICAIVGGIMGYMGCPTWSVFCVGGLLGLFLGTIEEKHRNG